jgi:hypothetical protein
LHGREDPNTESGILVRGAVPEGGSQLVHDPAILREREPAGGERRAGDVAAQVLEPLGLARADPQRGVQREAVQLGAQLLGH